ncbi:MAG: hypothetical protein MK101_11535 [Phycisphaerales bacterium]|nr:hypothetical protein [Phycisphaerales bacterium]
MSIVSRLCPVICRSICLITALVLSGALVNQAAADRVKVDLPDGSRWRGETGDSVKVTVQAGRQKKTHTGTLKSVERDYILLAVNGEDMPIFLSEIVSMEATDAQPPATDPRPDADPDGDESEDGQDEAAAADSSDANAQPPAGGDSESSQGDSSLPANLQYDPADGMPIFYLPMEGGVGERFREEEIRAIGREMDKLGPGQTLVLHINSPGGYVAEWQLIWQTIKELKKKHRVVAWVKTAISAAASTSLACSCIIFETSGALGSITTLAGAESPLSVQLEGVRELKQVLREGGYSEHFAMPFKLNMGLLTYDKDPETGEVTFYDDMTGDHILSDASHVLTINTREAVDCKFAIGVADSKEEVAELLNMGGWNEVGSGQSTFDNWQRACDDVEEDIQRYGSKLQRLDQNDVKDLNEAIRIIRMFIRCWDRAPNICFQKIPPKSQLELMLEEAQRRLRDIRRGG